MKLTTLIIASHNQGKVREIGELIVPLGLKVMSAGEAGVDEPEETGKTFAENATLKAVNAAGKTNLPALSDDSGLVIPALNGDPGIYSARWAGPDKNFDVAFARIQKELAEKNPGMLNFEAYFVCVLALAFPEGDVEIFEGRIDGMLTFPARGEKGFGYDPIFIPMGHTQTFAEIDPAAKNAMSHRAKAFEKFLDYLKVQA